MMLICLIAIIAVGIGCFFLGIHVGCILQMGKFIEIAEKHGIDPNHFI